MTKRRKPKKTDTLEQQYREIMDTYVERHQPVRRPDFDERLSTEPYIVTVVTYGAYETPI